MPTNDEVNDPLHSPSQEEVDDYIKRFEALQRDFQEIATDLRRWEDGRYTELIGPRFGEMLASDEVTLTSLGDPSPDVRQAALYVAVDYRSLGHRIGDACIHMAAADPDLGVRRSAVSTLGIIYAGSKDRRIEGILASFVTDPGEDSELRISAYSSLLGVHGPLPGARRENYHPSDLAEIDWPFVESVVNATRQDSK